MKKKPLILLTAILLIALALRLFRLTELFHLTMDEELIAWRSWGLFNLQRPFLIGGISPLQVHLPPYFYYLMALLLWPFNFNPVGWGISGAVVGIITIVCLFFLARKLFNFKTALYAVILQSFSFTSVFFDRHFWPMSLNPLLTVLSLWLLTKLSSKKIWPYLGLALVLLLALSADPSNISLGLALAAYFVFRRRRLNLKYTFTSLSSLIVVFFLPLFLFDIRHHWQNFGGINRLWQTAASHQFDFPSLFSGLWLLPKTLARFWFSSQNNLIEIYAYCDLYAQARLNIAWFILMPAIVVLLWFVLKIKNQAINLLLASYTLGLTVFAGLGFPLFDHYLTGLLPVFALISAVIINKLPRLFQFVTLSVFIFLNLWQTAHVLNPYGLKYKQQLIIWVNQGLGNQPFILESISKCHRENGLRYLFQLSGNPPAISFMDSNFSWLYPDQPATVVPDRTVLVTDKNDLPLQPIVSQAVFGALNAYILENPNNQ